MNNSLENKVSKSLIKLCKLFDFKNLQLITKSEGFKIFSVVFVIILFFLFIIPFVLSTKGLKFAIEQKVSNITKANFNINGNVDISFLPTPTVKIQDSFLLKYHNDGKICNLGVGKIKISFPFFGGSDGDVNKIVFENASAECYYQDSKIENNSNKFTAYFAKFNHQELNDKTQNKVSNNELSLKIFDINEINSNSINLKNLVFKNSDIILYNQNGNYKKIDQINFRLRFDPSKIKVYGDFINDDLPHKFNGLINFGSRVGSYESFFNLSSPAFNVEVAGDFISNKKIFKELDFEGKINAEIFDVKNAYKSFINVDAIYEKLKQNNQSIKINGSVKAGGGEIIVDNLLFNSDSINGKGNLILDFNYKIPLIDISLDLENLDLTSVWSLDRAKFLRNSNKLDANQKKPINNQPNKPTKKSEDKNTDNQELIKNEEKKNNQIINDDLSIFNDISNPSPNQPAEGDEGDLSQNQPVSQNSNPQPPLLSNQPNNQNNQILDNSSSKKEQPPLDVSDKSKEVINSDAVNKFSNDSENSILNRFEGYKVNYRNNILDLEKLAKKVSFTDKKKEFDLNAEINIKNIKYFEEKITDLSLYLTISRTGQVSILPLIFNVPNSGIFRLIGFLDNNQISPTLIGNLDAYGNDFNKILQFLKINSPYIKKDAFKQYKISSGLIMMPDQIIMNGFYMSLNQDQSQFIGDLKIDDTENQKMITSNLRVDNFNYDDYLLPPRPSDYISYGSLFRKMLWLNEIDTGYNCNIEFDRINYRGENFSDSKINLKIGQGYLEIANLSLNSLNNSFVGGLAINIDKEHPEFNLNLNGKSFNYQSNLENSEQGKNIRNILLEQKNTNNKQDNKLSNFNIFDQFFALPSLDNFNGKINIQLENMGLDYLKVENFKMSGKLHDGVLKEANLTGETYTGKFIYKGSIGLRFKKIISGNLNASGIDLATMLRENFEINNLSGISNVSSAISSNATDKKEFIKNLKADIKFNINSPAIEGYGLTQLVQKMFSSSRNRSDLSSPEKILFNPANQTTFKSANGQLLINKEEGKFKINASAPAITAILSGKINFNNSQLNGVANTIFLTDNFKKPIPISIASALTGSIKNIEHQTNLNQVYQYLGFGRPIEIKSEKPNAMISSSQLIDKVDSKI